MVLGRKGWQLRALTSCFFRSQLVYFDTSQHTILYFTAITIPDNEGACVVSHGFSLWFELVTCCHEANLKDTLGSCVTILQRGIPFAYRLGGVALGGLWRFTMPGT